MVQKMRLFTLFLVFTGFTLILSCEKGYFINCSDCITTEPKTTDLTLRVDATYSTIVINIYEGNLEDSILYNSLQFPADNNQVSVNVAINKQYTIVAKYDYGNKHYYAVDSAHPQVKYDKETCDNPCYYVYDRIVNLRLKYGY